MGRLIISNAISVNGAFEAPVRPPDGWLVLDPDSQQAALEMWQAADAMVMGRKTYEGLAAVWPGLANVPALEAFAHQMNSMPKYVASRTLTPPLEWNATLVEGDLAPGFKALKDRHRGNLIVTGGGELARNRGAPGPGSSTTSAASGWSSSPPRPSRRVWSGSAIGSPPPRRRHPADLGAGGRESRIRAPPAASADPPL